MSGTIDSEQFRLNVINIFVTGGNDARDLRIAELEKAGLRPDRHKIEAAIMVKHGDQIFQEIGEIVAVAGLGSGVILKEKVESCLKEMGISDVNESLVPIADNLIYFNLHGT